MVRVLIVEDDPAQQFLVRTILSRGAYDAVAVGNAYDALELLSSDPDFDAILSDYRLPGLDGVDFMQVVLERYPAIPVVMMSVHAGNGWLEDAKARGAAGAIAKPFFGPELIGAIDAAIRARVR
jgi:CheY-like chemotaxis protein